MDEGEEKSFYDWSTDTVKISTLRRELEAALNAQDWAKAKDLATMLVVCARMIATNVQTRIDSHE